MNRLIAASILIFLLASCKSRINRNTCDYFFPDDIDNYIQVSYNSDSILITETVGEFHGDHLNPFVRRSGAFKTEFLLIKKDDEYYWVNGSDNELFMSYSAVYSDSVYKYHESGEWHSILIKSINDSLFESTLFFNVSENHRNPYLVLLYDKTYKIKKIQKGTIFRDFVRFKEDEEAEKINKVTESEKQDPNPIPTYRFLQNSKSTR